MAIRIRLSTDEQASLDRLARSLASSNHDAVAAAIDLAAPRPNHRDFVADVTSRLLDRYSAVLSRLAEA